MLLILAKYLVVLILPESYRKGRFERRRINADQLQSRLVTSLQLRDSTALITDILHIFPPLLRMQFPHKSLSNLLVEYEPSVCRFLMDVVDSAVGFLVVAISGKAIWTFGVGVDEGEVDLFLDFGVELSETLDEAVGVAVVWLGGWVLA